MKASVQSGGPQIARALTHWLLPCAVNELIRRYDYRRLASYLRSWPLFAANGALRNRHHGERCFILCNGPSVNLQDLKPLRHEKVFSVSSGYHHNDYVAIGPRYHCVPQITYGRMTEADVVGWFTEMDARLGDAELFVSHTEFDLIRRHGLFRQRTVSYLCLARKFVSRDTAIPDIRRPIPTVNSVSILCLILALYMGFKAIYLLGTEHDSFVKGEYKYFYEPTVLKGKDIFVSHDGKLTNPILEELQANVALWTQYRAVKHIAAAHGVTIYNATRGGILDEFERVNLSGVLDETR